MASSMRSTAPATSSGTTSPARTPTSTSSPTTSISSTTSATVVIALGSNLGDRAWHLRRAVHAIGKVVRVVRVSSIHETEPVDAPPASPPFLNMVVAGYTSLPPQALLHELLAIEKTLGRVRTPTRNEPRIIDLDLILHGPTRMRTKELTLPHPRALQRPFVLVPMAEVWCAATPVAAFESGGVATARS